MREGDDEEVGVDVVDEDGDISVLRECERDGDTSVLRECKRDGDTSDGRERE